MNGAFQCVNEMNWVNAVRVQKATSSSSKIVGAPYPEQKHGKTRTLHQTVSIFQTPQCVEKSSRVVKGILLSYTSESVQLDARRCVRFIWGPKSHEVYFIKIEWFDCYTKRPLSSGQSKREREKKRAPWFVDPRKLGTHLPNARRSFRARPRI